MKIERQSKSSSIQHFSCDENSEWDHTKITESLQNSQPVYSVEVLIRVGRNIENNFRYYWSSGLEFFLVFNSIENSELIIFGIQ